MADGWGGKRKGAGRKTNLVRAIRELALEEAEGDAQYALGLMVNIMRDEEQPIERRMAAGTIVMDRKWGKPAQTNKNEESGELIIRVVRDKYIPNDGRAPTGQTSGASEDSK